MTIALRKRFLFTKKMGKYYGDCEKSEALELR